MAGPITQPQAEAQLAAYLAAETAVLSNQEYSLHGRTFRRADLSTIREGIVYWNRMVDRLSRGGIRIRGVTPV
jgi:hypothetical protein